MLKSYKILAFSLIFVLLATSISFAQTAFEPYNISVESETNAVFPTEYIKFNVTVNNNLDSKQNIKILVTGEKLSWVTLTTATLELGSLKQKTFDLYINPLYGAAVDWYVFKIKAKSLDDSLVSSEKEFNIYVKEKAALEILSFKTLKDEYLPGEEVTILTSINNTGYAETDKGLLIINISDENLQDIEISIPLMQKKDVKTFVEKLSFDKYTSRGEYFIQANLYDEGKLIDKKINSFTIKRKALIDIQQKVLSDAILIKDIEITVTNEGNQKDIVEIKKILLNIPGVYTFGAEKPSVKNGVHVWECNLSPGETCLIKYTANYWILLLVVLLIISLIIFVYQLSQQPTISKRVRRRGKERRVYISIKNRGGQVLRNVRVRDDVPVIFKVTGNFKPSKPQIGKEKSRTRLLWRLGRLEPKEERILSYSIELKLQVIGEIRLSPAAITGIGSNNKTYRKASNGVELS